MDRLTGDDRIDVEWWQGWRSPGDSNGVWWHLQRRTDWQTKLDRCRVDAEG